MNPSAADLDVLLRRCRAAADALAGRPAAGGAAETLLALVPGARFALWRDFEAAAAAVRAADGATPPECSEAMRSDIARLEGGEAGACDAPALGAVFGLRCLGTLLRDRHGPWAFLALGTPGESAPEAVAHAETVLTITSHFLSLKKEQDDLRRERDEFADFALVGQAAASLAHELNNLLNGIALQASVVRLQVDEAFHPALDVIRRQVNQTTALLRPLAPPPGARAKTFYPVDLVRAVREVLAERPALAGHVTFLPPPARLPPVRATGGALKQLVYLLLSGVSADGAAPLRAWAELQGAGVQLRLETAGTPALRADSAAWGGLGDLERLAGQSLLRHLDGALHVEAGPEGGARVRVCWKAPAVP